MTYLLSNNNYSFAENNFNVNRVKAERGRYFYEIPKKPVTLILRRLPNQGTGSGSLTKKDNPCLNKEKWSVACGFIDPTLLGLTSDQAFEFEQKEYKGLMRQFALYPNDAEAVFKFQKFNMWVLNKAMTASYTWQYNLAQHPDIDANVQVPVSQFGIQMIKNIEKDSEKSFWHNLSKTAFFVLITRSDNPLCQSQGTLMHLLEQETGMTVWNFSIDENHLPGFDHVMHYQTLPKATQQAILHHIQLDWLPSVYLYLKPMQENKVGHWIRVTSGITTLDEIKERTINFVEAFRHAIVKGADKSKAIKPDFSNHHLYQLTDEKRGIVKKHNTEERV